MSEQHLQSAPAPQPAGPPVPSPGGPQAAAKHAIEVAVARLEQARGSSLDDQLAAAEAVHEILSAHLSGSPAAQPGPR